MANPGLTRNSVAGCPQTEDLCGQLVGHRCLEHGSCVGSMVEPRCECDPGWSGVDCLTPTIPTTFRPQSYVKYALSFDADKFMTKIQLRFRTREEHGELFRVSDQHNREYAILEVNALALPFRAYPSHMQRVVGAGTVGTPVLNEAQYFRDYRFLSRHRNPNDRYWNAYRLFTCVFFFWFFAI